MTGAERYGRMLEKRVEELQAENAKLRACVELYASKDSWNSTEYMWLPSEKGYKPAQACLEELSGQGRSMASDIGHAEGQM